MSGGDRRTSTHDPAATSPAARPPAPLRQRWRAPTCTPAAGGGVLAPETAAADPAAVVPAAPVLHRLRPRASGLIAVQQRLPDMTARTGKQRSMPARSPASLREAAVPARQRPYGCGGGACRLRWRLRPEQPTGNSGGWQARPSEPAPHRAAVHDHSRPSMLRQRRRVAVSTCTRYGGARAPMARTAGQRRRPGPKAAATVGPEGGDGNPNRSSSILADAYGPAQRPNRLRPDAVLVCSQHGLAPTTISIFFFFSHESTLNPCLQCIFCAENLIEFI